MGQHDSCEHGAFVAAPAEQTDLGAGHLLGGSGEESLRPGKHLEDAVLTAADTCPILTPCCDGLWAINHFGLLTMNWAMAFITASSRELVQAVAPLEHFKLRYRKSPE